MDFEFSEAQEILRKTVRRFLAEAAPTTWVRGRLEDSRGTTAEVWEGLARLGLPGLLVPEALGGAALGMQEMAIVCEEIGRAAHPGPFLATALAAGALVDVATPSEQQEIVPPLAAGAAVATLAVDEPGNGAAATRPRTIADTRAGTPRLSGVKHLVLDGLAADLLLVLAVDGASGSPGLFAIDSRGPGVSLAAMPGVDPTRKLARLELADTPARRLGDAPSGQASEPGIGSALERGAVACAADALGAASRAHELAVAYARERVQFGRPIGSFQAVQHILVDMLRDLELARSLVAYAAWAVDTADARERRRAAAMAKAFTSGRLAAVAAAAIQVFGGIGFTWEHDAHLFYRRVLGTELLFGDEGAHLDELARLVVDA